MHGLADTSYALGVWNKWVIYKGHNILWLPSNRRPGVYSISNIILAGREWVWSCYIPYIQYDSCSTHFLSLIRDVVFLEGANQMMVKDCIALGLAMKHVEGYVNMPLSLNEDFSSG